MRNSTVLAMALTVFLMGCRSAAPVLDGAKPEANGAGVAKLFADYHEEQLRLYPLAATQAGDHRYDDQLPNNVTDDFRAQEKTFYQKYLAALRRVDRARLSEDERMSCDILQWECEMGLEQLRYPTHLMPINQFWSLHLDIAQWAGGTSAQPFKSVRDYDNWLKRLASFAQWLQTAQDNMRQGMKQGYVLPKTLTQKRSPRSWR